MGYDIYYNLNLSIEPPLPPELVEFINHLDEPGTLLDMGFETVPELVEFMTQVPTNVEDRYGAALALRAEWIKKHPTAAPGNQFDFTVSENGAYFYDYDGSLRWAEDDVATMMKWLIENVLAPNGHVLDGDIDWDGEETGDTGTIAIDHNVVTIEYDQVVRRTAADVARRLANILKGKVPTDKPQDATGLITFAVNEIEHYDTIELLNEFVKHWTA